MTTARDELPEANQTAHAVGIRLLTFREDRAVIAALYVDPTGCYAIDGVDAWGEDRDARLYDGPYPVVAHPPCQRWGRMSTGGPSAPGTRATGDDGGCFAAALASVRAWGGVLEHPADSKAWPAFGLRKPRRHAGWEPVRGGGWTCYVEQGHYGHMARKPTWLYAHGVDLPALDWTACAQRIHPRALELHGYEQARRIGMTAMIGGKDKTKIRNATPLPFRDMLLSLARSAKANAPS